MNRRQLEHAIRAACNVAEETEVFVICSQSILGQHPNAPQSLLSSMEVDIIPKNKPDAWNEIDGALGEESQFNITHGFYVQGLDLNSAVLPPGWQGRCVAVEVDSRSKRGLCLEAHDLALSKLAAFREKDLDFVRTLLAERLVTASVLLERLEALPVDSGARRERIGRWIRATDDDLSGASGATEMP